MKSTGMSRALAGFPASRVMFGSDFPLNLYPKLDETPGLIRFVAEANAGGAGMDVLSTNAEQLFGL